MSRAQLLRASHQINIWLHVEPRQSRHTNSQRRLGFVLRLGPIPQRRHRLGQVASSPSQHLPSILTSTTTTTRHSIYHRPGLCRRSPRLPGYVRTHTRSFSLPSNPTHLSSPDYREKVCPSLSLELPRPNLIWTVSGRIYPRNTRHIQHRPRHPQGNNHHTRCGCFINQYLHIHRRRTLISRPQAYVSPRARLSCGD